MSRIKTAVLAMLFSICSCSSCNWAYTETKHSTTKITQPKITHVSEDLGIEAFLSKRYAWVPDRDCVYCLKAMRISQKLSKGYLIDIAFPGQYRDIFETAYIETTEEFIDQQVLGFNWVYYVGTKKFKNARGFDVDVKHFKMYTGNVSKLTERYYLKK